MRIFLSIAAALLVSACSTTGQFRIPPDTTLKVAGRDATPDAYGYWKTKPFFWGQKSGSHYELKDNTGRVLRKGTLRMRFRAVSIFWPPFAFIYWPVGFPDEEFDLTHAGDGILIKDEAGSIAAPAVVKPEPVLTPIEINNAPPETPAGNK